MTSLCCWPLRVETSFSSITHTWCYPSMEATIHFYHHTKKKARNQQNLTENHTHACVQCAYDFQVMTDGNSGHSLLHRQETTTGKHANQSKDHINPSAWATPDHWFLISKQKPVCTQKSHFLIHLVTFEIPEGQKCSVLGRSWGRWFVDRSTVKTSIDKIKQRTDISIRAIFLFSYLIHKLRWW